MRLSAKRLSGKCFSTKKTRKLGQSLLMWNSRVKYPNPQILEIGKNALAYFATALVTKKKTPYDVDGGRRRFNRRPSRWSK